MGELGEALVYRYGPQLFADIRDMHMEAKHQVNRLINGWPINSSHLQCGVVLFIIIDILTCK